MIGGARVFCLHEGHVPNDEACRMQVLVQTYAAHCASRALSNGHSPSFEAQGSQRPHVFLTRRGGQFERKRFCLARTSSVRPWISRWLPLVWECRQ